MNHGVSAEQERSSEADASCSPVLMTATQREMAILQLASQADWCERLAQGESFSAQRWRQEASAARRDMHALIAQRKTA